MIGLLALPAILALPAQGEIRVSARIEPAVVKLGDAATLVLVVSGASEVDLAEPPEVAGLAIVQSAPPSTETRMYFDGVRQEVHRSVRVHFRVLPEREGTFDIPPLRGTAAGAPFETRPLRLEVVADLEGARVGSLEVQGPDRALYRGEVFRIEARLGVRADAVAERRVRDLMLRGAWFDDVADATRLSDPEPSAVRGDRIAVNGRETLVERAPNVVRDGVEFLTWRLAADYVATYPGTLSVGSSFLGLRYVRTWRETFFGERVPGETEPMFVGAAGFDVPVRPLPEEGQPAGYLGAIGRFRLAAAAEPEDVREGESIKLTLTVSGRGNLPFFRRPDLERAPGFDGFAFFGAVETKEPARRRIVYDLAPRSTEVAAIPPIRLDYFDPEAGGYRTLETEAIPIRVRPLPAGETLPLRAPPTAAVEAAGEDLRDVKPLVSLPPAEGEVPPAVFGFAALAPLGFAGAWLLRARRARRDADPAAWRRGGAERAFRKRIAAILRSLEGRDGRGACEPLARALAAYLADRLATTPAAILGSDVEGRLLETGTSPDLAREIATLFEECDRVVYAGGAPAGPVRDLLERAGAAVRRLEEA